MIYSLYNLAVRSLLEIAKRGKVPSPADNKPVTSLHEEESLGLFVNFLSAAKDSIEIYGKLNPLDSLLKDSKTISTIDEKLKKGVDVNLLLWQEPQEKFSEGARQFACENPELIKFLQNYDNFTVTSAKTGINQYAFVDGNNDHPLVCIFDPMVDSEIGRWVSTTYQSGEDVRRLYSFYKEQLARVLKNNLGNYLVPKKDLPFTLY